MAAEDSTLVQIPPQTYADRAAVPRAAPTVVPWPCPAGLRAGAPALCGWLLSAGARPLRFALTGGGAGLVQLGLLALLTGRGWPVASANAVAFLLAAQVNFVLSTTLTWRDRGTTAPLWRRWLMYHGSIVAMAAVNGLVFLAARTALPPVPASATGIAAAGLGNFLLGDRLVFRAHHAGTANQPQSGGRLFGIETRDMTTHMEGDTERVA
jgi:putative flippase GtrA